MGRDSNIIVNCVKIFVRRVGLAGDFTALRGTIGSADYGCSGLGNDCKVHPGDAEKPAFLGCGVPVFLLRSEGL